MKQQKFAYIILMYEQSKIYCYNKMMWLKPNSFYAELLQDCYIDELFSFFQISFQSFILMPFGEKIGKWFDLFASDDFLHAKRLAETIVMLGENPVFLKNDKSVLPIKAINYSKDIKTMVEIDIAIKENMLVNYKTKLIKIENKYIKNLLNSFIVEHENNLKTLQDIREKYKSK